MHLVISSILLSADGYYHLVSPISIVPLLSNAKFKTARGDVCSSTYIFRHRYRFTCYCLRVAGHEANGTGSWSCPVAGYYGTMLKKAGGSTYVNSVDQSGHGTRGKYLKFQG